VAAPSLASRVRLLFAAIAAKRDYTGEARKRQMPEGGFNPPAIYNEGCPKIRAKRRKNPMETMHKRIAMEHDKKIALVAHDNKKRDLVEWAKFNRDLLAHHKIYATGTTGSVLERELNFPIIKLQSGPLGGDQQIGAKIVDGKIDFLIFFWDPLEQLAHDPDVKALLRMALVWNIPIACNRASADFMISSPLMDGEYDRLVPEYDDYRKRMLP
jgi:methylglyoxal synthase